MIQSKGEFVNISKKQMYLLDKAKTLPQTPGCYMMRKEEKIIYIGKAKNLNKRVQSYFNSSAKDHKTTILVSHITDFDFVLTTSEIEALITENRLIKEYRPRYNIRLRDDKSYPYVVVDYEEPFPRLSFAREIKNRRGKKIYGPFVHGSNIKEIIRILEKSYRLRDCSVAELKRRGKPCILFQMQQCSAPCVDEISNEDYTKLLDTALHFFEGKEQLVLEDLQTKMLECAQQENFEQAAILRDSWNTLTQFATFYQDQESLADRQMRSIDIIGYYVGDSEVDVVIKMIRRGKVFLNQNFSFLKDYFSSIDEQISSFVLQYYLEFHGELPEFLLINLPMKQQELLVQSLISLEQPMKVRKHSKQAMSLLDLVDKDAQEQQQVRLKNQQSPYIGLTKLKDLLSLEEIPRKLECYDVAIWQGKSPTASQIVFEDGQAVTEKYRYYHLEQRAEGNNDFEMLKEVLSRRVKHGELPDLFIVDGGLGQVNSFVAVLEDQHIDIPVVGIAKSREKEGFQSSKMEKSEERLIIPGRSNPYYLKKMPSLFRIVTQMRDEAHRFSRKLHHKEEKKRHFNSELDTIPNIGPRTKRKILKNLSTSLEEIASKEIYQIMDELKVSLKVAKALKNYFFPN